MTLEQVFESPATLAALRSGPLGTLLEGFCKSLLERGFSRWSVRTHLSNLSHLNAHFRSRRARMRETLTAKEVGAFFEDYASRCRNRGPLEPPNQLVSEVGRCCGSIRGTGVF
jgi:integrase/recombinase XerD